MEVLFTLLLTLVGLGTVIGSVVYTYNRNKTFLTTLCKLSGLLYGSKSHISGRIENYSIDGYISTKNKKTIFTITLRLYNKSFPVRISKEDFLSGFKPMDFITGDAGFDSTARIYAINELQLFAHLNSRVRSVISDYLRDNGSFNIEQSSITFNSSHLDAHYWNGVIKELVWLADQLSGKIITIDALKYNIRHDPSSGFRKSCILCYLKLDQSKEDLPFLRELAVNHDLQISALAAGALGKEGLTRLSEIIKCRKRSASLLAIDQVKEIAFCDESTKALVNALQSRFEAVIEEALLVMKIQADPAGQPDVLAILEKSSQKLDAFPAICIAVADYFGKMKTEEAYDWLLKQLKKHNMDLIIAAIHSISNFGRIEAVQHLLPLTKGIRNNQIKVAARNTIQTLQHNIPQNERGGLTLSEIDSDNGQLSIPEDTDRKGHLSMDESDE